MGRLSGKVALVTGGAGGMGEAHVRRFVAEGAKVCLVDRLDRQGQELAAELGDSALYRHADVTSEAEWRKAIGATEQAFGPINVLINNAGIVLRGRLETFDETDYRRVIDVNQVAVFLGMKAVIPSMRRAKGGAIINISSVCGFIGRTDTIAYTASKFAVRGMSKVAAVELATDGIRVNSVHPGPIVTPMFQQVDQKVRNEILANVPLKRLAEPEEVTNLVLFLASDEANFITGSEYVIDGGMLAG